MGLSNRILNVDSRHASRMHRPQLDLAVAHSRSFSCEL
jgi:hypothetical protein